MTDIWRKPYSVVRLLSSVVFVALLLCAPLGALADDYPSRPIHLIITTPAGSLVDVLGRLYAEAMSARLGQPIVVDNRSGGMTMLGTDVLLMQIRTVTR
jgi:tripartite-type tricarboxylate transporter receptor subunit TctC